MGKKSRVNTIPEIKAEQSKPKPVAFEDGESVQSLLKRIDREEARITPVFTMWEVVGVLENFRAKVLSLKDVFSEILEEVTAENPKSASYLYTFEMACDGLAPNCENDYDVLALIKQGDLSDRLIMTHQESESRLASDTTCRCQVPDEFEVSEDEARMIIERRKRYGVIA